MRLLRSGYAGRLRLLVLFWQPRDRRRLRSNSGVKLPSGSGSNEHVLSQFAPQRTYLTEIAYLRHDSLMT